MGINLSWIAVQGVDEGDLLDRLGLEAIGEASDEINSVYACSALPGGWVVVTTTEREAIFEATVTAASVGLTAIACEMSETVMYSRARAVRDGVVAWSVTHDPDVDLAGVSVEGDPPSQFATIKAGLEAEQRADGSDSVDYIFDVPIDLAASICGYKPMSGISEWTVLQRKGGVNRPGRKNRSLKSALREELTPWILSRGWQPSRDHPELETEPMEFDFVRWLGSFNAQIWLDYKGGEQPWLSVSYAVWDGTIPNRTCVLQGEVREAYVHRPLWKVFLGIDKPPPPAALPDDAVGALIDLARSDITALDAYLDRGEPNPRVHHHHGAAKDTWPRFPGQSH